MKSIFWNIAIDNTDSGSLYFSTERASITTTAVHIIENHKPIESNPIDFVVKQLIETTMTKTGLTVKCNIIKKMYKTGKKMRKEEKEELVIIHDDYLGHWNYTAIPSNS